MNVFGDRAKHTILSAMPDQLGARAAIDSRISVEFPGDRAPALHGKPGPARYRALAKFMSGFDLVLTYNWGSMDAVGARRLHPANCPPLIHHEDGFNADEAMRLNWKRNAFRRLMLPAAQKLVVVSERLEKIALDVWHQPASRTERIPNGIDVSRYSKRPKKGAIPGFERREGEIVVGTLAGLREVKNLPRLVRAVASAPENVRLIIVGEGPERDRISAEAQRLGIGDRVLLPGFIAEPANYVGHFDVFALSSDSEQFPISLVEAMAAGLPVVSTDVGDVANMVSEPNRGFVSPVNDENKFNRLMREVCADSHLRNRLGEANWAIATQHYDEASMIRRYADLYNIPQAS
jgi:L-malate glycosyltransferase